MLEDELSDDALGPNKVASLFAHQCLMPRYRKEELYRKENIPLHSYRVDDRSEEQHGHKHPRTNAEPFTVTFQIAADSS